MEYRKVTKENIENEHICCSITEKKGEQCISSKKEWMLKNFNNGLTFLKANIRGKVFIEYIPAEYAWYPIKADNFMHINCFWVSGQYKSKGYANELLEQCIEDARQQGKDGLTIIASEKKKTYLMDASYLTYKGFKVADTAHPYFVLYYLPLKNTYKMPSFNECSKAGKINEKGIVLYYTNQCPFTEKYINIVMELAKKHNENMQLHKIDSLVKAQQSPTPFTTYGLFYNGTFITNEIQSEPKFIKFLSSIA